MSIDYNCGGDFREGQDGVDYRADVRWQAGLDSGYVGGTAGSWRGTYLHHDGPLMSEREIYLTFRSGDHSYRFETVPGDYELTLRFLEVSANGPNSRYVTVTADGIPVIDGLDIYAEVGEMRSFDHRVVVAAGDSLLEVALTGVGGDLTLAGIALRRMVADPLLRPAVPALRADPTYDGALVRWDQPEPAHLDGYLLTVENGVGDTLSTQRTHRSYAVVAADPDYRYYVEAVDSMGRLGDSSAVDGVAAKPIGDSSMMLMELWLDEADLRWLEDALPRKQRVPAQLVAYGETRSGELSFRGETSLELPKKSYKFRVDEGPEIFGADEVALAANFVDQALVRENLGCRLMEEAGHPSYRSQITRLNLNGEYAGVFFMLEEPSEEYLRRIGYDEHGRSFKVSHGLLPRDHVSDYVEDFDNTNSNDWERRNVVRLIEALNHTRDVEFEGWARATFDVPQVLNW